MASEATTPECGPTIMWITKTTRKRVRDADPNGGRCLVENTSHSVDYCHCIPMRYINEERILNGLEWWWNMRQYSLDLNTHYNIFRANSSLRHSFDQRQWLLMPEDCILDKFHESLDRIGGQFYAERKSFPNFSEKKTFLYRFVPMREMEKLPITQQNFIPTDETPLSPTHFTIHLYPFKTLPLLESHLHPKFVIFDAGRKLENLSKDSIRKLLNDFPSLGSIMDLYSAWIRPPPSPDSQQEEDPSYIAPDNGDNDGGNDNNDEASYQTPPRPRPKKRKASYIALDNGDNDGGNDNNDEASYQTPPRRRPKKRKAPALKR